MKANLKFAPAALGFIALLGMTPTFAADTVFEEPPAPAAPMEEPPVASWGGAYAGITLGYGFEGRANDSATGAIDTDGFVGGAFAGYNYDAGGIVAGVEADINYSGVEGANGAAVAESGVDGSLRARLGYAVTPDILPYITAGGAAQRLEITDGAGSDANTTLGWTAGVGTDVKVTENVFGRVEYRYTDFGSETFNTGSGARSVDSRDHRIQFGVGMKF